MKRHTKGRLLCNSTYLLQWQVAGHGQGAHSAAHREGASHILECLLLHLHCQRLLPPPRHNNTQVQGERGLDTHSGIERGG
jgi:hypothetical protein